MTLSTRFLLPALLILCPASAAPVPATLAGEWFQGPQYPAGVYTSDFGGAGTDASRLLLNRDGTYLHTRFESTVYPSSFGTTGFPITCQMMDVTVERGKFEVQGGSINFRPAGVNLVLAMSPDRLNSGCKRSAGIKQSRSGEPDSGTWQVGPGGLTLKVGQVAARYVRRKPAPPAPEGTVLDPSLRGEWHNGAVSPTEYYNTATGRWAEASGTSVILRLHADLTYERTGLTVVTTYGCTSKLLVHEKGTVKVDGQTLTFTPKASSATGYTCTPDKVSSARNHVKPYTGRAIVKVDPRGHHTLSLTSGGAETLFGRPPGTAPQGPPGRPGALTPPVPGAGSTATAGGGTPRAPLPAKWNARGEWDAVITTGGGTIRVRFSLDDDEPRLLGSGFAGENAVGWLQGNSQTGALKIGLEIEEGREVELNVTGRFSGDSYSGRFTTTNASGEALAGGTITMTRR